MTLSDRFVIQGATVIDGTGAEPRVANVTVGGGRFLDVDGPADGATVIDGTGKTLIPGLIDCHVHVLFDGVDYMEAMNRPFSYGNFVAVRNLEETLKIGITTVRDAGGADLGIKMAIEDGLIRGPRLSIAISILSQTGGHSDDWFPSGACVPLIPPHPGRPDGVVDGVLEMQKRVRELRRAGADVIKVCASGGVLSPSTDPRHPQFTVPELEAAVAEAGTTGLGVMAHAQSAQGIRNAIQAGVRSIEHGIYLDDQGIEMMLERGTFLVPTLSAPQAIFDAVAAGAQLPEAIVRKAHEVAEIHQVNVARAVAAGVKVAMGTDSGVGPHGKNLTELDLMVECGMTPVEAIKASSQSAAELLGLAEDLGTIEIGKCADFVLVDGAIDSFANLKSQVRAVYKDGVQVV